YVLTLKNQSSEQTVMNVSTTLKSLDTLYQVSGAVNYGTIGPGETSTGTGYHTIAFSNQVPHNIILPIEIRISSDSILYWIDTLDIITDVKDFVSLPKEYSLSQNYPNPFNPNTTIKYSIPRESEVRLEILNVLGERVELLVNEIQTAGAYESVWDARNVSSGIYFYRMQAGSFIDTKKMILLK
ncbi:MAG: T9SS type A sorting domain-containing protein, partial [Ignavibacteriaceae bacterium]|nr:T9SS type A sorting domain-containing protein [Ignavibacteriaceae bacterium]